MSQLRGKFCQLDFLGKKDFIAIDKIYKDSERVKSERMEKYPNITFKVAKN